MKVKVNIITTDDLREFGTLPISQYFFHDGHLMIKSSPVHAVCFDRKRYFELDKGIVVTVPDDVKVFAK